MKLILNTNLLGRLTSAGFLFLMASAFAATTEPSARVEQAAPSRTTTVAQPRIEGLDVLASIGTYTGELRSYTAVPPTQTQLQNIAKISDQLAKGAGITFVPVEKEANDTRVSMLGASDPSASFEYDERTGNFLFNGGMNGLRAEGSTPNLPNQTQAVAMAARQLTALGLQPAREELLVGHVGGLNMGISDGSGATRIFEKLRSVRFSRTLGGVPVEGNTRILVQLGTGGSVAGLIYQWPTLKAGNPETPDTIADADTLRSQATDMINKAPGGAMRSVVTKADLVLFDDGRGRVEPAYHVVVEQYFDFKPGTTTMNPYDFYLPALRKPQALYPQMQLVPQAAGQDLQSQ
jgi:hypothetical protein